MAATAFPKADPVVPRPLSPHFAILSITTRNAFAGSGLVAICLLIMIWRYASWEKVSGRGRYRGKAPASLSPPHPALKRLSSSGADEVPEYEIKEGRVHTEGGGPIRRRNTPYEDHFPNLEQPAATLEEREQMERDKELYHALQNLGEHPDAPSAARSRLLQMLDQTVHEALEHPCPNSISSIDQYSPEALRRFFQTAHTTNTHKYEAYINRRRAGGPREIFPHRAYAEQWLKLAACVKYVDGSWVGNILNVGLNRSTGRPASSVDPYSDSKSHIVAEDVLPERNAAKLAWQVITEEFGDGDLAKNHVYLYHRLIQSLDPAAQPGNVFGFDGVPPTQGAHRCWTAAVAQQCIGLLASTDDFFPESLGFNMAYETLPYHLLVTSRELRELGVDDYYFALHITIDNPDSGHAAIAREAVERYLDRVEKRDGRAMREEAWRRVKAGVILADGLPTTPSGPIEFERGKVCASQWVPLASSSSSSSFQELTTCTSYPTPTNVEREMTKLLIRKSTAAEKMHCSSRIRIEGLTVEEWLDPSVFDEERGLTFLRALGRKKPWVVPGDSEHSRLVRELQWGGRMFGAFSAKETDLVRSWIEILGHEKEVYGATGAYRRYVGSVPWTQTPAAQGIGMSHGRFAHHAARQLLSVSDEEIRQVTSRLKRAPAFSDLNVDPTRQPLEFACLWFTYLSLLEHFPLSPSKLASPLGMIALRILRAIAGFPDLHAPHAICAGMDQLRSFPTGSELMEFNIEDVGGSEDMGLWEIGYAALSRALKLRARDHDSVLPADFASLAKRVDPDGPVAELCADMLALRSRPYGNAAVLLGLTLGGSNDILGSHAFLRLLNHGERSVVERVQREIGVAVTEYTVSWSGY